MSCKQFKIMKNVKQLKLEMKKINEAIFKIVSFYECPPNCHAYCCVKLEFIDLTDIEYNKLHRLSYEKADKAQKEKINDRTYAHRLHQPCPFLGTDELCTAYNIRPIRCHTYPFSLTDKPSPFMQIFPCLIGKEIIKDFIKYMIFTMEKNNDIQINTRRLEFSEYLGKLDEKSNLFYSSTNSSVEVFGVAYNEIINFSNYLNNTKTLQR